MAQGRSSVQASDSQSQGQALKSYEQMDIRKLNAMARVLGFDAVDFDSATGMAVIIHIQGSVISLELKGLVTSQESYIAIQDLDNRQFRIVTDALGAPPINVNRVLEFTAATAVGVPTDFELTYYPGEPVDE